jgi:hypothetical protein
VLRRLLLLPLLAPLLAMLIVAALNPRPATSLRLLTWRSPALPLGLWIGLAGAGGALLSAGATRLALRQGESPPPGRSIPGPAAAANEPWDRQSWRREQDWEQQDQQDQWSQQERWEPGARVAEAGGSRAPGEPPPTVSVPFRVVRHSSTAESVARPSGAGGTATRQPEPVPAGDGWDSDWNAQASDDW